MEIRSKVLPIAVAAMVAVAAPALAVFPVVVQTICDVDFPGCVGGIQGLRGVRGVDVSADGMNVYFCSALDDTLSVFDRSSVDGTLALIDQELEPGDGRLESCRGVAVTGDGEQVYSAALLANAVSWFTRNSGDGSLSFRNKHTDGVGGVDGLAGAHAVALDPNDQHVYVASRSDDAVAVFERNDANGDLTFLEAHFDGVGGVDGLNAAEAVAVSPDGENVYVAGETDNAVSVFTRETAGMNQGRLTFLEVHVDGVDDVDGLDGAGSIAIDSAGENVYVGAERGSGDLAGDDWVAVFARDAATGALTFLQALDENDFGTGTTGIFAFCSGVGPENAGVTVSANDLYVFVTNSFFGTVATFLRDPLDGTLSLIDSNCDLNFGADGLAGVVFTAASPDGENLYASGSSFEYVSTLDAECDSAAVDLVLMGEDVSTTEVETACRSISVTDYSVLAAGEVTMRAPRVLIGDGFAVTGSLVLDGAVP